MDKIKKCFYATFKEEYGYGIKNYCTQYFNNSDVITIIIFYAADITVSIDVDWETGDIRKLEGIIYFPKLQELQDKLHKEFYDY